MLPMSKPNWSDYDGSRGKPRINLVMAPAVRAMAEELAEKRGGVSLSTLIEALVTKAYLEEQKKDRRRP